MLAQWKAQCSSQKISNTGQFQTFSFFGLVFTISVGVAIIVVSLFLEPVVSWKRQKFDGLEFSNRKLARIADGKFQHGVH